MLRRHGPRDQSGRKHDNNGIKNIYLEPVFLNFFLYNVALLRYLSYRHSIPSYYNTHVPATRYDADGSTECRIG